MNETCKYLAVAGLVLAPLTAMAPPAAAELTFPAALFHANSGGIHPMDATARLIFETRSNSWPPCRFHQAGLDAGSKIRVEIVCPATAEPSATYDYSLPIDVRMPGRTGSFPIELYALEQPDDPEPQRLNVPIDPFFVGDRPPRRILEAIPAQPTEDDEIVLLLDRRASGTFEAIHAIGVVQIRYGGNWFPAPAGWPLAIGKLPPGKHRIQLRATESNDEIELVVAPRPAEPPEPAEPILAGDFEVAVAWETAAGENGAGRLVQPPSRDSALFYFFSPANWELMVKVLDGCAINGHYWVFGAASTDVGYRVDIRRRGSSQTLRVENPIGTAAPAITDIAAFPCDPAAPTATPSAAP